jgi:hypothetical protein
VIGHIRAESWTRIFLAFIEKLGILASIKNGALETWFPTEDKVK